MDQQPPKLLGGRVMSDVILTLDSISKSFDGEMVIDNLNLEIERNEFITLLGPSGCGKSTTLRIIGGFVKPDEGRVLFEGKDITDLPPDKRNVNTVFQKYSLFPHMTVEENIAFGLKLKKKSKQYIKDKIAYALKLVNMEGYGKQAPTVLSGGQQQRVAIARAIVNEPKILLLDEPLGALDLKLRHGMQRELIKIKQEVGITFIYVTHDQEEALTMSDRIIVMNQGIIQQMGTSKVFTTSRRTHLSQILSATAISSMGSCERINWSRSRMSQSHVWIPDLQKMNWLMW